MFKQTISFETANENLKFGFNVFISLKLILAGKKGRLRNHRHS